MWWARLSTRRGGAVEPAVEHGGASQEKEIPPFDSALRAPLRTSGGELQFRQRVARLRGQRIVRRGDAFERPLRLRESEMRERLDADLAGVGILVPDQQLQDLGRRLGRTQL